MTRGSGKGSLRPGEGSGGKIWGKGIPGTGNSMCKGPGVGTSLQCQRSCQEVMVAGERGGEDGGWGPDCVGPCRLWCCGHLVLGAGKKSLCKRNFQGCVCVCWGPRRGQAIWFLFWKDLFFSVHCWEERAIGSCGQMEEGTVLFLASRGGSLDYMGDRGDGRKWGGRGLRFCFRGKASGTR